MAIEVERLIATLEARLDKFEKSLAKASGTSDRQFKRIEDRGKKMERTLAGLGVSSFKGLAAGALGALGPILSVAAAVNGAKQALDEFGNIADNAKASGLDAEFFQGLAYQAQLGGVAFDQLSGALATFAKNSGLAVAGKGKMVTALKALNPALLENIRSAKTQEERVKLVADALSLEADASKRAAIATAAFGDAGSKLAGIFEGGAAQIEQMQINAKTLGVIVDRELIAKADELGDQFDTATKIVDLQLKQALVNLAPVLIWIAGLAGDIAETIGYVAEGFKGLGDQSTAALEKRLEHLQNSGAQVTGKGGTAALEAAKKKNETDIAAVKDELRKRAMDTLRTQLTEMATKPAATEDMPTLDQIASRDKAAAATIKQAEAVQKLTAELMLERQGLFLTAEQQAALNAVNSAGIDVNSRQGQELVSLALANERLKTAMEQVEGLAQSAVSTFVDDLRQGKSAADALANSLQGIANKLLDMALNSAITSLVGSMFGGGGAAAGLLTNLFGGFRANGGQVQAGKGYIVGEKGPEPFFPKVDGTVLPSKALSAGGGQIEVVVSLRDEMLDVRIDNRAANVSARVTSGGIASYDKALPGRNAEKSARYG